MSALQTFVEEESSTKMKHKVNDFSITVATVNGSGSQTANLTLLRALFKMGIPVSGKNLFPSNIQGLPTWYTIRVSKDGYLARKEDHEIVVAMNPATFVDDLADVLPGGAFFYADDINYPINRQDIAAYPMPVKQLAKEFWGSLRLAQLRGKHGFCWRPLANVGNRFGYGVCGFKFSFQG